MSGLEDKIAGAQAVDGVKRAKVASGSSDSAPESALESAFGSAFGPASAARTQMDWDDLRFFLAVAAAGSLSGASRVLHVNTTTVLRRIAHLETTLDVRLFERLRSGYTLTADGARLLEALDPVDERLSALQRDFQTAQLADQGVVRLALGEILAAQLVAPALFELNRTAPNLRLDLVMDVGGLTGPGSVPRVMNHMRDVDLALRLSRPTQGDMLVRKLGELGYGLYASRQYLDDKPLPSNPSDLSAHKIIGFLENEVPLGPVWWLSRVERDADVVMRSSHAMTRAIACRTGLGLAALPSVLAADDPELVEVFPASQIGFLEIWLLARSDMAKVPRVRQVMDALVLWTQQQTAALAGHNAAG